ncbi:MAG: hypothetical protein WBK43_04355 [Prolixibacteraceae bacterium]|jgi:hypothetical protein|nr:hypothetical protein [Prolixibacteraceae bacterium]MDI9562792.1 hypothetical protein [Bacteroidota bacterium]NLS99737.1 hypothetical protein [Bacteroidales bacterium]OQB81794.1 MAG: hypothetical protein BWX87_00481 [Bacteroidetes bacterium ADurb.Bin123]HNU78516.1 hypothetical protein [Prolixibacteraceae bacterium]
MTKLKLLSVGVLFLLVSGFDIEPASEYEPVFMLRSEMEKGIRLEGPRDIRNPGKIYLKDDLIFINEKYLGIHVIDNTDPAEPENFAFIRIDGCIDMAMKDQVLYADNAVDLISLALSPQMTGVEVTSRLKDVFPELQAPDGRGLTTREQIARPDNAILVRWKERN